MGFEYRVEWQRRTGWSYEDGTPIPGRTRHRLYQTRWGAEKFRHNLHTVCFACLGNDKQVDRCGRSCGRTIVSSRILVREVGAWQDVT